MGWFSKLLGTDKALDTINTIAEGGISLADNAFYTDQEKADFRVKQGNMWLKMNEIVAKQSSPTSISRRVIAWAIIAMTVFSLFVGTCLILLGRTEMLNDFLALLDNIGLSMAFPLVMGFYFGPHIFSSFKSK